MRSWAFAKPRMTRLGGFCKAKDDEIRGLLQKAKDGEGGRLCYYKLVILELKARGSLKFGFQNNLF